MGIDQRPHCLVEQLQHFPLIIEFFCIITGKLEKIKAIVSSDHIFSELGKIVGDTC